MTTLHAVGDEWGNNSFAFAITRDMAVGMGLAEPTPQEAAEIAARREWARNWYADRIQRRAAWFSQIQDAAGPVAAAILDLHVPGGLVDDDCGACYVHQAERGLPWPCPTVLAAAEIVGIPEPEGI